MNEAGDDLLSPPPSTPTGDTPSRSRTPPAWANAVSNHMSSTNIPLTLLSPLQQRQLQTQSPAQSHRMVSPLSRQSPPNSAQSNISNSSDNPRERLIRNYEMLTNSRNQPRSRSSSFSSPNPLPRPSSRTNSNGRSNSNRRNTNRYESPLSTTPNRVLIRQEENVIIGNEEEVTEMQEVVNRTRGIRLGAGMAVGSVSNRILEEYRRNQSSSCRPITPTKSVKQRPSHRKLRRWNNDNLVGIATDIAKSHKNQARGEKLANAFLEGQAESYLYSRPNYPLEYRSAFATLTKDDSESVRKIKEKFIKGEVAYPSSIGTKTSTTKTCNAAQMYQQINSRLQSILEKAHSSNPLSFPMQLIDSFEWHLKSIFDVQNLQNEWIVLTKDERVNMDGQDPTSSIHNAKDDESNHLKKIASTLITDPIVARVNKNDSSSKKRLQYIFDAKSPTGAYHRLLVHALCKFHGLHSISSDTTLSINSNSIENRKSKKRQVARVLTISGKYQVSHLKLKDHLVALESLKIRRLKLQQIDQKEIQENPVNPLQPADII